MEKWMPKLAGAAVMLAGWCLIHPYQHPAQVHDRSGFARDLGWPKEQSPDRGSLRIPQETLDWLHEQAARHRNQFNGAPAREP
jgi:hypothetical protein